MAGEISLRMTLTSALLQGLQEVGLKLTVQVDCSYSCFVRTVRPDRPQQPIISKPIELDCALSFQSIKTVEEIIGLMQARSSIGPVFQFYSALNEIGMPGTPNHGLRVLSQRNLKIEFPNFDVSIINLQAAPLPISYAIAACNARTVAAFNNLSPHVRKSMGMHLRSGINQFALSKAPEFQPRTAVA